MPPTTTVYKTGNLSRAPKLIVDVIASGQGNSILVSYPNGKYMLVDCGSQAHGTNNTLYAHVSAYITTVTGGNDISCVVLTHGDQDHTSWIPDIDEAQRPKSVFYGGLRRDLDDKTLAWVRGQERRTPRGSCLVWDFKGYHSVAPDADFQGADSNVDTDVYVLAAGDGDSPNARSVVLLLVYGTQGVVLTGDATTATEGEILANFPGNFLSQCTLLVPGHHGAFESTAPDFQDTLAPDVAALSASGTNASYAHPNCATLQQLTGAPYVGVGTDHFVTCSDGKGQAYGTSQTSKAVYVTGTNGDIRLTTDGTKVNVKVSSIGTSRLAMPRPIARPAPGPPTAPVAARGGGRR